ncbi:non-ribosomal peptide synthetase [Chamaesiphon polymorphus]|uniref:Non-ribosomal peptide synthetase n=1 Tax=Chamaesiphon polymorphus CCALA 037 TaxID=2107692 RepID=A0A2T1FEX7_9CYAN|nr:non-ribosomal peptide synthetase [Chamaesiphon polymorphus]PSB43501.1 non-ribosomal peptide synthetase [Chamaesiphon polymorphus CCALA 037]
MNISDRIANLSPEKLALLQERLMKKGEPGVKKSRISPRHSNEPAPLSFAQQRLWFLNQLEPDSPFNISIAIRMNGDLNVDALAQTLNAMVDRHLALRTTFAVIDERVVQLVMPSQAVDFRTIDLSHLSSEKCQVDVDRILSAEPLRPFNLAADLMLRATLIRLNESEHILLLVMHHIAADGWSVGILFREFASFYEGFAMDNPVQLPELTLQYTDFAQWQREYLTGDVLKTQLEYWRQHLADAPRFLTMTTDRPRPSIQTFKGGTIYFQIDRELTQQIKNLCQQSGSTLFMVLMAAFGTLLSRYSGQDDVVIGSPIANRHRSEVESIIGCFINTLALRVNSQGNPTFLELLAQVRETTLGAYDRQDFPLEKLVEELQPERSLSHALLFQTMFVLQNTNMGKLELPGLTLDMLELEELSAQNDIFVSMEETEAGMTGELGYNSDLFDRSTIDRLAINFQTLLASIVANPNQSVTQLPLLGTIESQQLLIDWNDTQVEFPLDRCFAQLFEQQVATTPTAIAVVFKNQQLTYQQLNDRANRWARHLVELGVEAETIVALMGDRDIDFLTAILAVFKAGGAYLPLNPEHPAERIQQVLLQGKVPFVLAQQQYLSTVVSVVGQLETKPQILYIEELERLEYSTENLPIRSTPDNLAYVIYTSGSTGTPKGAMLEQRGMVNHLYAKVTDLKLGANDIVAQTASQTFDISIWQFLVALLVGGKVEIVPTEIATDPTRLFALVQNQQISVLEIVPSLLRMMLQQIEDGATPTALSSLRWLLLTGEALPPQLCRQWFAHYPSIPMLNAYGPTECSDDVTHYPIDSAPAPEVLNLPIGRPIANTQLYILDNQLQPVPIGVAGELYVGGAGVGRGYLNAPELTEQAFIPNPFSPSPSQRLYKTGDKARYLPDGNIEFLGRIDFQVKIRGFRIELGEIEAVLSDYPQVREATVIDREEQVGNQYLAAYIVASAPIETNSLREFLKQKLPDYMVPSAFIFLDSIPLTPNGKVDRKALPIPDLGVAESNNLVAPETPTQVEISQLWAEILNLPEVGIHNNFFELGGHSLLATQIMSRLRSSFGVELPLRKLFEAPTVAELADCVDRLLDREEIEI